MNNIRTAGNEPFQGIPYLYYGDPMEGKDILGKAVHATTIVEVTGTMATKEQMFLCHESQLAWLSSHHGVDEAVGTMRALATMRGETVGVRYGEGFRQHLGHAFPQDEILKDALQGLVHHSATVERA
jgi:hypothetical protein